MILAAAVTPTAALEINDANRAQLEQLNGLGVAMTERILVERQKNGPFADWTDFQARVKGMRGKTAARLQAQGLTVGGHKDIEASPKAAGKRPSVTELEDSPRSAQQTKPEQRQ